MVKDNFVHRYKLEREMLSFFFTAFYYIHDAHVFIAANTRDFEDFIGYPTVFTIDITTDKFVPSLLKFVLDKDALPRVCVNQYYRHLPGSPSSSGNFNGYITNYLLKKRFPRRRV